MGFKPIAMVLGLPIYHTPTMENFPFDTVALTSDVIDLYNDTYKVLRGRFGIELTGNINFQLEQFELFKNYFTVNTRGSYAIRHENNNDC